MAAPPRPRIALLGIHLEANAFAPVSTRADFEQTCYLVGESIVAEARQEAPAMPMEMASFVRTMDDTGPWEPVPILLMGAEPGGPIEQGFFEATLAEISRRLREAGPVNGVYISNHGAMCATGSLDPDGDQFRMVRSLVGPDVPIVVTVDLHCNLSQEMADAVDLIVGYRTNPHVDQVERGVEAAHALHELLGGTRVSKAFVRLPLVPVQTSLLTAEGPYAELIEHGQARKGPDVLNVTVLGGFSYGDAPRQGLSVLVTARGEGSGPLAAAQGLAKELAGMAWEHRRRFTRTLTTLEDAVALAVRTGADPALPAHILADVSDNPGGGGRSNTVYLLRALVQAGAQGVLLGNFYDPPLAAEAHRLGVGSTFQAHFNREETARFSEPLTLPARVEALADNTFVGTRGIYAGRTISLGPCAALRIDGVTVVVGSHRKQCADPVFFTNLGLDPAAARTVVVKSRGHFRAGFDRLFAQERVIEVACPGLTTQDLASIPYRNIDKAALFPFNADVPWNPPDWMRR